MPFSLPGDKPTKRAPSKLQSDDIANFVSMLFLLYASTKHPALQRAWQYSPDDCAGVAAPLAKILNRMPTRYVNAMNNLVDPLALLTAFYTMIQVGQANEKELLRDAIATGVITQTARPAAGGPGSPSVVGSQNGISNNGARNGAGNGSTGDGFERRIDIPIG